MNNPAGFLSHPAFHVNGTDTASPPVFDTSHLYYNGNSQGGIEGGALTAISPDFTRATLGVPGMNYSVLLTRSVDFDQYANLAMYPQYPDELARPLALTLIQMLWDRGEANGYARRMTTNPLPDTPPHKVLLNVAFGDHQVTTWAADNEARTIGAQAHAPVVYPGRWPGVDQLFGIPRIKSYPFTGSAIVYWDSGPVRANPSPPPTETGTSPPPLENLPNRSGRDPHELPRRTAAEQQMVSDFLRPDGQSHITDTCAGGPCFDFTFSGPYAGRVGRAYGWSNRRTCWKVGRLVQRIVSGISPGWKLIRSSVASARQADGTGPCAAASWAAAPAAPPRARRGRRRASRRRSSAG